MASVGWGLVLPLSHFPCFLQIYNPPFCTCSVPGKLTYLRFSPTLHCPQVSNGIQPVGSPAGYPGAWDVSLSWRTVIWKQVLFRQSSSHDSFLLASKNHSLLSSPRDVCLGITTLLSHYHIPIPVPALPPHLWMSLFIKSSFNDPNLRIPSVSWWVPDQHTNEFRLSQVFLPNGLRKTFQLLELLGFQNYM